MQNIDQSKALSKANNPRRSRSNAVALPPVWPFDRLNGRAHVHIFHTGLDGGVSVLWLNTRRISQSMGEPTGRILEHLVTQGILKPCQGRPELGRFRTTGPDALHRISSPALCCLECAGSA